jgi:D-proline reductase (dithiol) PrdB
VALVSTAGLHGRDAPAFASGAGATEYRVIASGMPTGELIMSHISANFDSSGFRHDVNLVYPPDRLRELEKQGEIGSVANFHYSFMGTPFPPTQFEAEARELEGLLKPDAIDAAILIPV